jgi:hypothetical protein
MVSNAVVVHILFILVLTITKNTTTMKLSYLIGAFFIFSFVSIEAQECELFIPGEQGVQYEHTSYNKKGKVTGIYTQTLDKIESTDTATLYYLKQVHTDPKGKDPFETDLVFKCVGETFYVDMSAYIDQETMKAYEDMDVKVTTNEMNFPNNMVAGQHLNDGSVKIEVTAGAMPMTFTIDIKNRLVEDIGEKATPAGTFECIRISEDVLSNFGFMKFNYHTVTWYSEKIGVVRSETYKGDNLKSYTELTAVNKK